MPGFLALFAGVFGLLVMSQTITLEATLTDTKDYAYYRAKNYTDKYRVFVRYAMEYMTANPTATGSIHWDTIRSGSNAPAPVASLNMPPSWRIVSDGATYSLCTEFPDDISAGALNKSLDGLTPKVNRVSGNVFVIDDPASATLATEAAKCN